MVRGRALSRGGARPGAGRPRKRTLTQLVVEGGEFYPRTASHLRALREDELELPDGFPADCAEALEAIRLAYREKDEIGLPWEFRHWVLEARRRMLDRAVRRVES